MIEAIVAVALLGTFIAGSVIASRREQRTLRDARAARTKELQAAGLVPSPHAYPAWAEAQPGTPPLVVVEDLQNLVLRLPLGLTGVVHCAHRPRYDELRRQTGVFETGEPLPAAQELFGRAQVPLKALRDDDGHFWLDREGLGWRVPSHDWPHLPIEKQVLRLMQHARDTLAILGPHTCPLPEPAAPPVDDAAVSAGGSPVAVRSLDGKDP